MIEHILGLSLMENVSLDLIIDIVCDNIMRFTTQTTILKAPLSDHCFINLIIEPKPNDSKNKGYWKFNAGLLQNEEYWKGIREIIKDFGNNLIENYVTNRNSKLESSQYISVKNKSKRKRNDVSCFLQEISQCCCGSDPSNKDNNTFMALQTKLYNLYLSVCSGCV